MGPSLKYLLLPDGSMFLLIVVGLAVLVTSILYLLWGRYRKFLEEMKPVPVEGLPILPHSHWFLGHIPSVTPDDFRKSYQHFTRDYSNEYGQTGYWIMSRKIVVSVTDYEDARTILNISNHREPINLYRRHMDRFL
jgi:hypothetical protein